MAELQTIRDFIAFLSWKRATQHETHLSAESKAEQRLKDVEVLEMWVTTQKEGDAVNVLAYEQLRQRGYPIQIPSENS
jgi:hypothetical protein